MMWRWDLTATLGWQASLGASYRQGSWLTHSAEGPWEVVIALLPLCILQPSFSVFTGCGHCLGLSLSTYLQHVGTALDCPVPVQVSG